MRKKRSVRKSKSITFILTYGLHIWLILIIANFILIYSVQWYSHASSKQKMQTVLDVVPSVNTSEAPTSTPTPTPVPGPILDLSFTFPGIGSGGGNMNPLHQTRSVTLYLYPPDVSVFNKYIHPTYLTTSQLQFDNNPDSPTYTTFINHHIDVGANVKDGRYQLLFKTDQAIQQLVTKNPGDVAGIVYSLNHYIPQQIPVQRLIVGDIAPSPHGNNVLDIKDYNALVACFSTCLSKQLADLDDNGVVDGIDYNILLTSFKTLLALGYPVPTQAPITPTPGLLKTVKKIIPGTNSLSLTPTIKPSIKRQGNGIGGILLDLLLLVIIAVGGFFIWKRGLLRKFLKKSADQKTSQAETTTTPAETQLIQTETTQAAITQQAVELTVGEYFVKKKSVDEKNGGIWLTLADDTGQHTAYYKGVEADIKEGFATVKGTMTNEGDDRYLLISEIKFDE